jgi:cell division protein FtsW
LAVLLPQFNYRLVRIQIWKNPWLDPTNKGYQPIQSLYAVGSGGLFGLGLGESRQKLGFIPEAHNDIIFAIVCEELGLVGAAALLILFIILIWRGIKTAMNAPDLFSSLVSTGIVCMIGIQVLINVAVITNTIPTTGMPLPFISYGGSSLLFTMTAMGILLNISRYSRTNKI